MEVNNPNVANTWITDDGRAVGMRTYPITEWNMNANLVGNVDINIANSKSRIIAVFVKIFPDSLDWSMISPSIIKGIDDAEFTIHISVITDVGIKLNVIPGSELNVNPEFSGLGHNRGILTVMYLK